MDINHSQTQELLEHRAEGLNVEIKTWISADDPNGRVAEWFKAPVLKFAFPCFVHSSLVPRSVISFGGMGLFIPRCPIVARVVSGSS